MMKAEAAVRRDELRLAVCVYWLLQVTQETTRVRCPAPQQLTSGCRVGGSCGVCGSWEQGGGGREVVT